jgi:hypothetical protein
MCVCACVCVAGYKQLIFATESCVYTRVMNECVPHSLPHTYTHAYTDEPAKSEVAVELDRSFESLYSLSHSAEGDGRLSDFEQTLQNNLSDEKQVHMHV